MQYTIYIYNVIHNIYNVTHKHQQICRHDAGFLKKEASRYRPCKKKEHSTLHINND